MNQCKLTIDSSKLSNGYTYILSVNVLDINGYVLSYANVSIPVRDIYTQRTVADLGITENLIKVSPNTGVSGIQIFKAEYTLGNVPYFMYPLPGKM